jgi:hypothetical protein
VRYQADKEQNDEDEEAYSGNLRRSKSHNPKTQDSGYQGHQKEHQRIVKHGNSSIGGLEPAAKYIAGLVPVSKYPIFIDKAAAGSLSTRRCLPDFAAQGRGKNETKRQRDGILRNGQSQFRTINQT